MSSLQVRAAKWRYLKREEQTKLDWNGLFLECEHTFWLWRRGIISESCHTMWPEYERIQSEGKMSRILYVLFLFGERMRLWWTYAAATCSRNLKGFSQSSLHLLQILNGILFGTNLSVFIWLYLVLDPIRITSIWIALHCSHLTRSCIGFIFDVSIFVWVLWRMSWMQDSLFSSH